MNIDIELQRLGASLYERRMSGVFVPGIEIPAGYQGWRPVENRCHDNVQVWTAGRPEHKAVRGFLFFDLARAMPYVWFNAHSVVETEDGSLIDITSSQASQRYPFIRHTGGDELFELAGARVRLTHYI